MMKTESTEIVCIVKWTYPDYKNDTQSWEVDAADDYKLVSKWWRSIVADV